MNAVRETSAPRRWPEGARWGVCFVLALCFHGAGAAALMAPWSESTDLAAGAPVVMVDLAPLATAPEATPNIMPPDEVQSKEQIEPDPPEKPIEKVERTPEPPPEPEKPVEKLDLPPIPKAEVVLPVTPPPKPKPKRREASIQRDKSSAEQKADRAAAPMPGPSSRDSDAVPNWKSRLVAHLERYKRYPSDARGDGGVAMLAFSIDRNGGVHNARIVRSSGSSPLDRETLALVERAQPLPPPPPEMGGAQIGISVPIRFSMR